MTKKHTRNRLWQVALLAAVLALMFMLSSCGGGAKYADSEYLGTWKATTASMSGVSIDVSTIFTGDFTLELAEDGTATVNLGNESYSGDWEETDDGFKITDSSDELEFTKTADGEVTATYDGVDLVFELQE